MAGGALFDVEQLVEAQSILVPSQSLLVQLEFPQPFVLLVASGAGVLHQVEAGLGGVVAQCAVVDTQLQVVRAVLLLQVLGNRREESADVRWRSFEVIVLTATFISSKHFHYSSVCNNCKDIWVNFNAPSDAFLQNHVLTL